MVGGESDGVGTQRFDPSSGVGIIAGYENANPGWVAEQQGVALEPVVIDGWRQGWRTSGEPEPVTAHFAPGTTYRWSLAVGMLALLGLLAGLATGRRRPHQSSVALAERSPHPAWLVCGALVASGVLAGPAGLAVALLAVVVTGWTHRVQPALARALLVVLLVPAIGVYAVRPWGGIEGWAGTMAWPSYLVVAVVSGVLVVIAAESRALRRRRNRMPGVSTVR